MPGGRLARVQLLIRIPPRLRDRLRTTSEDLNVGMNVLVTRAIETYLDRLEAGDAGTPVEEPKAVED